MNVESLTDTVHRAGYGNTRAHRNVPEVLLIQPPAWSIDALCAQVDPELFYPEKGGSTRQAKQVCQACPVRLECLEYALVRREPFGIFGGLSERERHALSRARGTAA